MFPKKELNTYLVSSKSRFATMMKSNINFLEMSVSNFQFNNGKICYCQFAISNFANQCQMSKFEAGQCPVSKCEKYNNQCQNLVNQDLLSKKKQDLTPTQLHPVATVKHI